MQVENSSHMQGSQTLGLSALDTAPAQVLDGWWQVSHLPGVCGQGWSCHPPWASLFLLLPLAVLLSRLCPAHHHPQGTSLGVPRLQRVSPWFASLQYWPRAPKKPQEITS